MAFGAMSAGSLAAPNSCLAGSLSSTDGLGRGRTSLVAAPAGRAKPRDSANARQIAGFKSNRRGMLLLPELVEGHDLAAVTFGVLRRRRLVAAARHRSGLARGLRSRRL